MALAGPLTRGTGRYLKRRGFLTQIAEHSDLAAGLTGGGGVEELTDSSTIYGIAVRDS